MSVLGDNGGPKFVYGGEGWIAMHRSVRDHWLVGFGKPVKPMDPNFGSHSRNEAFSDLIMECRYEAGFVMNGGRKMEIKPGQLVGAISWLANRWNWTPQTVRTFLDKLQGDGMIERNSPELGAQNNKQKSNQSSIISVCNYEKYQFLGEVDQQAEQQASNKPATSEQQASNNNIRKNKGIKEEWNNKEKLEHTSEIIAPSALVLTDVSGLVEIEPAETDRKAINRAAAKIAFDEWRAYAKRTGLRCPRETSFAVFGKKIAARMFEHAGGKRGVDDMLAIWRLAIANVDRSSFLRGLSKPGFSAELKFLCQRESFAKVIDGGYGNGAHAFAQKKPENEWDRIDRVLGKTVEIDGDDDYKLIEGTLA